jgi:8-amino-7-oxononanoate synthase
MEGAERIMLGSNNYLGLTGDERVKQGAATRSSATDRADRLAPAQRHDRPAPRARARARRVDGTEDAIVFTTGHQANVGASARCSRPATRSSSTPATTPRSSTARPLARQAAPFRHNRLDKLETTLAARRRRRRRARRRRRRVLDGGRRAPTAEIVELCARMAPG